MPAAKGECGSGERCSGAVANGPPPRAVLMHHRTCKRASRQRAGERQHEERLGHGVWPVSEVSARRVVSDKYLRVGTVWGPSQLPCSCACRARAGAAAIATGGGDGHHAP